LRRDHRLAIRASNNAVEAVCRLVAKDSANQFREIHVPFPGTNIIDKAKLPVQLDAHFGFTIRAAEDNHDAGIFLFEAPGQRQGRQALLEGRSEPTMRYWEKSISSMQSSRNWDAWLLAFRRARSE